MQLPESYVFFSQPKINSGKNAMEHIYVELASMDARKPLVLASRQVTERGLTKKFIKSLYDSNVVIGSLYDEVYPYHYACISQLNDLVELFKARGCDSIIAIGGGSVVDLAKGVNIAVSNSGNIMDYAGTNTIQKRLKPFIYVSTGHCGGTETSNEAYIENRRFVSDFLFPDVIILDNRMITARTRQRAAEASMVALTAAIESCAVPYNNPMNDLYANVAINFIYENLLGVVKKPGSKTGNLALANAYAMAGISFSNIPPGIVYSLGIAIARDTGLPRGQCMGFLLPLSLEHRVMKNESIRGELLYALLGTEGYCRVPEKDRTSTSITILRQFVNDLGGLLPKSLKEMRVNKYKFEEYARQASEMSMKRVTQKDCMQLLDIAWEGIA
ncbi:MAG TPA: iron-containing alcohol dehydrogenase [Spirochaetota bacterium]|nr:iron-containing alcohol dehydrogenase [Spirochaetota bacterium]HPJ37184.1 iron-containing alcohol dehydrogenase [Spirochaetota bacterium]